MRHVDPEQLSDAARDVDPSRKIAIELQTVKQNAAQQHTAAERAFFRVEKSTRANGGAIGDDKLFQKSPKGGLYAAFEIVKRKIVPAVKLRRKLVIPRDRSLNQLGEKRDEKCKAENVFLRRIFSPLYVDQIPHRLENIKGNAERQDKIDSQKSLRHRKLVEREIPVFDEIQKGKIEQKTRRAKKLLLLCGALFVFFFRFSVGSRDFLV